MMGIFVRTVVSLRGIAANQRFERATARIRETQEKYLLALLSTNQNTVIGRRHKFSSVKSVREFVRRVPIHDYEGLRPYVDLILSGKKHVLTTSPPIMFGSTSGTTAQPKLIPVTKRWKKELANIGRIWLYRALLDHPGLLDHRLLSIVSPIDESYTNLGLPIGAVSGLSYARVPAVIRRSFPVPYEVFKLSGYDERYFLIARFALGKRVSLIAIPNPSTLMRLSKVIGTNTERLIRAIHDGSTGFNQEEMDRMTPADRRICEGLKERLRPSLRRAAFLDGTASRLGTLKPKDAWPDLKMLGCWLGGTAGIHAAKMREDYGPGVPIRDLGLRATEATITIPISDETPAGVLAGHTNFYEFVPEEAIEQEAPHTLLAHELEIGKRYYLIITSCAGLWRYDINDIVEVQDTYREAPVLAFLRKGRDMANITGEKLHANQVLWAVDSAAKREDLQWVQAQMIPDVERCAYDLLIEFERPDYPEAARRRFLEGVDKRLAELNPEYHQKRKSRRLSGPRLHCMIQGWADRKVRRETMEMGKRETQYKWPNIAMAWDNESRQCLEWVCDSKGES